MNSISIEDFIRNEFVTHLNASKKTQEKSICNCHLLQSFVNVIKVKLNIETNSVDPDQTAPLWVKTVCWKGFKNISADDKSRRLLMCFAI